MTSFEKIEKFLDMDTNETAFERTERLEKALREAIKRIHSGVLCGHYDECEHSTLDKNALDRIAALLTSEEE